MRPIFPITLLFIFIAATAHGMEDTPKSAGDIPFFASWFDQEGATGDWNGLREKLEDQGITISSNYITDIGGNPFGGMKQSAKYSGFLAVCLALDFEKIADLKGLSFNISNFWASGRDLSGAIGNFFAVQEIYTPGNYFLGELNLSLSLIDDTLTVETGRLFAGDVFATSNLWQYYVSAGVNSYLGSVPANIFFPSFNIAAWAVRTSYEPNKEWQFITAIYNADTRVSDIGNHGAFFSFAMDNGYLALGQMTYKHDQEPTDKGLPGSATFGCYYQSSRFQDLSDVTKRWHGNYGFYAICDQMLFRGHWPKFKGPHFMSSKATYAEKVENPYQQQPSHGADRPTGLTAWIGGYLAPQKHINSQIYQLAGGLVYQGLPPNRDRDVTAFCVILGKFSDELDDNGIETVLEINHRFQVGRWFYITPDIQYVINPNGSSDIDDALVLGVEISSNF